MLWALMSRNALAVVALVAFVGWAATAVKKHDDKVARAAVVKVEDKARAKVAVAKEARRRVDPAGAGGVLAQRYCADCDGR